MTTKVLLIGLGNIGLKYDLGTSAAEQVFTHARAFSSHPDFELVGAVDIDVNAISSFKNLYSRPVYSDLSKALQETQPEMLVVATPTETHYPLIKEALAKQRFRAILCEKPLSYNTLEAQAILDLCEQSQTKLFVNYFRRSDEAVNLVRARIQNKAISLPARAVVWYSKGLFNSASHMINLFLYWFGSDWKIRDVKAGQAWQGHDPEPDFILDQPQISTHFIALDANKFFHNRIEIVASNGVFCFELMQLKLTWQALVEGSPTPKLTSEKEELSNSLSFSQYNVVDQIAKSLKGLPTAVSQGPDSIETVKICEAIGAKL